MYGNYPGSFQSPYFNPYSANFMGSAQSSLPRQEIIHVNGKNGADALQMAPNSNTLVLDDTAPIVWLCQTDGAGYKTVTPYSIAPYKPEPVIDIKDLEERVARLEEKSNDKPNTRSDKSSKNTVADGKSSAN